MTSALTEISASILVLITRDDDDDEDDGDDGDDDNEGSFKESFRLTTKWRGRYRDLPNTHCPINTEPSLLATLFTRVVPLLQLINLH